MRAAKNVCAAHTFAGFFKMPFYFAYVWKWIKRSEFDGLVGMLSHAARTHTHTQNVANQRRLSLLF